MGKSCGGWGESARRVLREPLPENSFRQHPVVEKARVGTPEPWGSLAGAVVSMGCIVREKRCRPWAGPRGPRSALRILSQA